MYQAAIFFDNELQNVSNVKSVCGPITSVQVDETPDMENIPWNKLTEFTSQLGPNKYYELMKHLYKGDAYDKRSGIEDDDIATYVSWEESTRTLNPRACIVDWDRTLTKVEGFTPPVAIRDNQLLYRIDNTKEHTVPIEDFLTYLCGSKQRYRMLKVLFRSCVKDGVDIVVLTNNGAAADPELIPIFQTIVNTFTGIPTKVIASSISPFDYHKGLALQGSVGFDQLCGIPDNRVPTGGATRRKTHCKSKAMRYSRRSQYKRVTRKRKHSARKTRRIRKAHSGGSTALSFKDRFMNMLRNHPEYNATYRYVQNQIDMPVLNPSFPVEYGNRYIAVIYGGEDDNTTISPKLILSIVKSNGGIDQILFTRTNQSVTSYLESINNPDLMALNEAHSAIEQGVTELLL